MLKETLHAHQQRALLIRRTTSSFIRAPCGETDLKYYHWHIEIMPKLTKVAGFEWGSGFYINPDSAGGGRRVPARGRGSRRGDQGVRIVMASAEVAPFARVGGLSDVVGALSKATAESGHEVSVFLPKYASIDVEEYGFRRLGERRARWRCPMGEKDEPVDALAGPRCRAAPT